MSEIDRFEIIDDNDVIHAGLKDEMDITFDTMTDPNNTTKINRNMYLTDWTGDLKLIQIHQIYR